MSFYLAWSLTKLILTLLAVVGVMVTTFYYNKKLGMGVPKGVLLVIGLIFLMSTLFSAVNTGERQSTLGRSGFNSDTPVLLEKINTNTFNSDEVNKQFKSTIGDK